MRDLGRMFYDRSDAGEKLAQALRRYRGRDLIVLGIPRGGVPVAAMVADRLDADLDIIVARKIGAPGQPEVALGAVTSEGVCCLNEPIIRALAVPDDVLAFLIDEKATRAREREAYLRKARGRARAAVAGRIAILVDDGLATGATMRAAVRSLRMQRPRKLIVAVPVASRQAVEALEREVDELVCLAVPEPFLAVGNHYEIFEQTQDEEVIALLQRSAVPARA